jgi:hypothetical protein
MIDAELLRRPGKRTTNWTVADIPPAPLRLSVGLTRPEDVTWRGEQTLSNCGTIRAVTLSGPPPATPEPIGPGGPKERSGCLVALYVVLGLGVLLIVIAGIGSWLFLRSEEGQRVLEAARQGVEWAEDAAQAPGTAELRESGCETAMVTRFGQIDAGPLPARRLLGCGG